MGKSDMGLNGTEWGVEGPGMGFRSVDTRLNRDGL